jgi:hypothetical protein
LKKPSMVGLNFFLAMLMFMPPFVEAQENLPRTEDLTTSARATLEGRSEAALARIKAQAPRLDGLELKKSKCQITPEELKQLKEKMYQAIKADVERPGDDAINTRVGVITGIEKAKVVATERGSYLGLGATKCTYSLKGDVEVKSHIDSIADNGITMNCQEKMFVSVGELKMLNSGERNCKKYIGLNREQRENGESSEHIKQDDDEPAKLEKARPSTNSGRPALSR